MAITANGMLDNAPSKGRGSYVKLPEGMKFFTPEKGRTYKLIFLPWKAGSFNITGRRGEWVTNRYIPVHKNIGPGEETFICSAKAFGKKCAVCEGFNQLRQSGAEWDAMKDLKFKDRELFLVHDTEIENPKNVFVWDESIHLFGEEFRMKIRKKKEYQEFADFEKGSIVEFDAVEKKMGKNSCTECKNIEITLRKESLSKFLLDCANKICVDNFVVETPYADLKRLFSTTGGEEETEDTESVDAEDMGSAPFLEDGESEESGFEETSKEDPEPEPEDEAPAPVKKKPKK